MELIADGLLIATALTAGLYCLVLSRRLRNLTNSGGGIGTQIESLDRALTETHNALKETRESVSELRTSTRSSVARLSRETSLAVELAERLDTGVARAEATMQRLYQAESRIEAHQTRRDGDPAPSPGWEMAPADGAGDLDGGSAADPDPGARHDGTADDAEAGAASDAAVTRVELPDSPMPRRRKAPAKAALDAGDSDDPGPGAMDDDDAGSAPRSGRNAAVLKVKRMRL